MSEPTKEELLAFMRKHEPEKVDSITDTESAIRHFRCMSKVYKEQRDTLIDDIAVLKANISRLERELKKKNMDADRLGYRWRNSHDEAETYKSLLSEFSQHIGNKPASSTYKYFRAKLDNLNITEDK
ncbi:acetyltransferase [Staphylococcus saprophyticus]|nr:acetyltransferase [Staphylococcus saprophyticus]MDW4349957.1 acetyltransferase [Staphylococcus saprophyticus]